MPSGPSHLASRLASTVIPLPAVALIGAHIPLPGVYVDAYRMIQQAAGHPTEGIEQIEASLRSACDRSSAPSSSSRSPPSWWRAGAPSAGAHPRSAAGSPRSPSPGPPARSGPGVLCGQMAGEHSFRPPFDGLLSDTGPLTVVLITCTLVGGTSTLLLAARLPAERRGLVGGVSLWLGWEALRPLLTLTTVPPLVLLLPVLCGLALTVWLLRPGRALPLPASGLSPIQVATSLLLLPASLGTFGVNLPSLSPGTLRYLAALLLLCSVGAVGFSRLFNAPAQVARVRAACGDAADEQIATRDVSRAALYSAGFLSLYILGHFALSSRPDLTEVGAWAALASPNLLLLPALVLDLLREWRARRDLGDLATIWELPAVHAVNPVLRALSAAGIPAHARGAGLRTLFQFFGPFAPVQVMVPTAQAAQAEAVLWALWPQLRPGPASAMRWNLGPLTQAMSVAVAGVLLLVAASALVRTLLVPRPNWRLTYRVQLEPGEPGPAAAERDLVAVRGRLEHIGHAGTVRADGDRLIVELAVADEAALSRARSILMRPARLEFKIVDDGSKYMERLGALAAQIASPD